MKSFYLLGCCLILAGVSTLSGSGPLKKPLPPCEPGYQWVEEVCYQDVERLVCKMVPDVIKHKKIVYSQKDDPFCIPNTGLPGWHPKLGSHRGGGCEHGCKDQPCPHCEGPYCRKLLVKKEVVCEEPTVKCVVEKVVERVAYTVLRKVPCGSIPAPAGPGLGEKAPVSQPPMNPQ